MIAYPKRLLVRVSDPATEPLTLAEAKLFLRVDGSEEDALVTDLITAVRVAAEEYLRLSLITQSWKLSFNDCAPVETYLPRGPVTAITSVTAYDRAGASTTVSSGNYYLDAAHDTLVFDAQIVSHRVDVVYVTGYGNAAAVPRPLKLGMLAHIAALYERRGEGDALPQETIALYAPFREVSL